MTEQSFETLKVWQKAHQLMVGVHQKLLPLLSKDEKYGLLTRRVELRKT